ncbi:MAG TPA: M4 family metallopeptidase [Kofleriaceae bacterium]|nr:M4 family metallopeptidase [Kofleriaceae bacterium]
MARSSLWTLAPLALAIGCGAGDPSDPIEASMSFFARGGHPVADPISDLALVRSNSDDRNVTHVRFRQLYQGVPVFEGEAITHVDAAGDVTDTNALRDVRGLDVRPRISRDEAIGTALRTTAPADRTEVGQATLKVLPRGDRSAIDRLVWHVTVSSESDASGPSQWEYFVDAHNGALAWSFNALETSASVGTGKTMYTGNQSINTDATGGTYYLRDLTRGGGNYTCDQKNKTAGTCSVMTSSTNSFGNNVKDSSDRNTAGADAHFGLQATWDYYATMFGRNGINGAGKTTYSRVHYGNSYQNAFWSDSCACMTYGDGGSTFYPLVSIDVAGHEMSHGVMSSEANLTYSGESGGLNESNSDIFGTLVEFAANSTDDVGDWWIGERIYRSNWSTGSYVQSKALRYMDNPAADGASPACWSSSIGSLDVHYSSGPNNHMFYLLANGGTSKCNGNVVAGIGRDKAARIWYKAIADYMTASTNYKGARTAALNAATALYGAGSAEYNAVAAAYSAINVN